MIIGVQVPTYHLAVLHFSSNVNQLYRPRLDLHTAISNPHPSCKHKDHSQGRYLTSFFPSFSSHQTSASPPTVFTFSPSFQGLTGTKCSSTNRRMLRCARSRPSPPSYALDPSVSYSFGSSHGFRGSFSTAELSGARTVVLCDASSRRREALSMSRIKLAQEKIWR